MPNVPPPPISARMTATGGLERRLEQAERAEGEKPSPEQVKALALRMAEQRQIDPWQVQPPQRRGYGR